MLENLQHEFEKEKKTVSIGQGKYTDSMHLFI